MEIERCVKGEKTTIPCVCVSESTDEGWTFATSPANGVIVRMNSQEKIAGGVLITEGQLAKVGYSSSRQLSNALMILTKKQLAGFVASLGDIPVSKTAKTKCDMVDILLEFG